jgi:hypothetical protein
MHVHVETSTSTTATVMLATTAHDQHAAASTASLLPICCKCQAFSSLHPILVKVHSRAASQLSQVSCLQAAAHQSCMSACMIIVPRMHGMLPE